MKSNHTDTKPVNELKLQMYLLIRILSLKWYFCTCSYCFMVVLFCKKKKIKSLLQ